MLKKIFFVVLLGLSSLIFARDITEIKSLSFDVAETNLTREKKSTVRYSIDIKLPSTIKKVIYFPEINKGEQYIYKGTNKTVYIPAFNQIKHTETDGDENLIVEAIKKILQEYKQNATFRNNYEEQKVLNVSLNERNGIGIQSYQVVDEYILPKTIYIYDGKNKIFELSIADVQTNLDFSDEHFTVHKSENEAEK